MPTAPCMSLYTIRTDPANTAQIPRTARVVGEHAESSRPVKANVDRILGIEKDTEIEKDEPTSTRS